MAIHSSTLAWKIPWTEEPVGYSPWGCKESDMTERLLSVLVRCFEILDLLGKSETLSLLRDSAVCTLLCSDKAVYQMWMWPFSWVEQLYSWEKIANWGMFLELSLVSEGAWCLQWILMCRCVCLVAQSCLTLCNSMDCSPPGSSVHGDSPGKNTGVGCHASPTSSRGSSPPRNRTWVSPLQAEPGVKAGFHRDLRECHLLIQNAWVLQVAFLFEQMFCYFVTKVRRFEQCCPEPLV